MDAIYVGKLEDGGRFELNVDSLTKHAIVLGATGSGKTVLCKAIVEELALLGYPVLAIDPKGDIGTLAIVSEDFDFRPWSDFEAKELGVDPEEYSEKLRELYERRLREWGISRERVREYAENVRVIIYTPRGSCGVPLSIRPNLDPLPNLDRLLEQDPSIVYDAIDGIVTLILRLAGYSERNVQEHALLSKIIEHRWLEHEPLTLEELVELVINPPFERIGSLDVDTFIPERARVKLARSLNVLLSHPAYQGWMRGEPINFDRYFNERGQISVIDLRFMTTPEERQLFVGALLQELYRWLLRKGGASRLRFLLYFDELVGFAPPVGKPPSKAGLMLLVKQGRAFGLGCLLATQNPADVDYKLLSNAAHRFIGRLATKQDIDKVKRGLSLEGAMLDRIPRLRPGTFLYHNYERGETRIVRVRWLMTYHRGPLQPEEIKLLTERLRDRLEMPTPARPSPPASGSRAESLYEAPASRVKRAEDEEALVVEIEHPQAQARLLRPRYNLRSLTQELKEHGLELVSLSARLVRYPCFRLRYKLSVELDGVGRVEREGELILYFDGRSFQRPTRELVEPDEWVRGLEVRELKVKPPSRAAVEALRSRLTMRIYYSPLLRRAVVGREELSKLREAVEGHITRSLEEELERLRASVELRRRELERERPLIEAELRIKEKDLELLKVRVERLRELRDELRRRRLPSSDITAELRRMSKEMKSLEAEVSKLRVKLTMLEEELKQLDAVLREKEDLVRRKYEAMRRAAILHVDARPQIELEPLGELLALCFEAEVKHPSGRVLRITFEPYEGLVIWGRCEDCGRLVVTRVDSAPPLCKVCGAPLCAEHRLACAVCSATLCSLHAERCAVCGVNLCPEHAARCYVCGAVLCPTHAIRCYVCSRVICPEHAIRCVNKDVLVCPNCVVYKRRFFRKVPYCPT